MKKTKGEEGDQITDRCSLCLMTSITAIGSGLPTGGESPNDRHSFQHRYFIYPMRFPSFSFLGKTQVGSDRQRLREWSTGAHYVNFFGSSMYPVRVGVMETGVL